MEIAVAQPEQDAVMTPLVEAFIASEQELANPIERVGFAAAMAERLVLDAPAHLVDAAVGDAHHVEGISDADPMVEVRGRSSRSSGAGQRCRGGSGRSAATRSSRRVPGTRALTQAGSGTSRT